MSKQAEQRHAQDSAPQEQETRDEIIASHDDLMMQIDLYYWVEEETEKRITELRAKERAIQQEISTIEYIARTAKARNENAIAEHRRLMESYEPDVIFVETNRAGGLATARAVQP